MDANIAKKTADPYVTLRYGDEGCCYDCCLCMSCCFASKGWQQTEVQKGTLEPVWNEWFSFRDLENLDLPLIVRVMDWDKVTLDDMIFKKDIHRKWRREEIDEFTITESVKNNNVRLHLKAFLSKRDQPPSDADGNGRSNNGGR